MLEVQKEMNEKLPHFMGDFAFVYQELWNICEWRAKQRGKGDFWQRSETSASYERAQYLLVRLVAMYSVNGDGGIKSRKKSPNSYMSGTSKPSCNFSKRVYRSSVQEILIFREEKRANDQQ